MQDQHFSSFEQADRGYLSCTHLLDGRRQRGNLPWTRLDGCCESGIAELSIVFTPSEQ